MTEPNIDRSQQAAPGPNDARPEAQPRRSPRAVRTAAFNRRMRGYDENEVREFLTSLADEIEVADAERTAMRAEIERLRHERQAAENASANEAIDPEAVALFSQAQQVADRVVAEAVQHAQELMANAREQQRDILKKAHSAAELAASKAAAAQPQSQETAQPAGPPGSGGEGATYERPIPEVEYVRTFARVAQVQLKSVLDALAEQVDKLGELPDMSEQEQGASSSGSTPSPGHHRETTGAVEGSDSAGQPPGLERRGPVAEPFGSGTETPPGTGTGLGNVSVDRPSGFWP